MCLRIVYVTESFVAAVPDVVGEVIERMDGPLETSTAFRGVMMAEFAVSLSQSPEEYQSVGGNELSISCWKRTKVAQP